MQIIERNAPNNGYETGDTITHVRDSHVFVGEELNTDNFTIKSGLSLSDGEAEKLTMVDSAPLNVSAIMQLPTFRSLITGEGYLRQLHRRKYKYDVSVTLKPNAQSRDL